MIHAAELDREDVQWLNADRPLSLAQLQGRLVLLDFWTFCCVNCLHVLPLLKTLERQYRDQLVVIGVHSPKFTHERDITQVRDAIARYDIDHPVIHDPDRKLWDEFAIRAWPTLVLISADGHVIGNYPGEPRPGLLEALIEQHLEAGGIRMASAADLPPATGIGINGDYSYPAKLKRLDSGTGRWALADTGNHQIALLGDDGTIVRRFGSGSAGFQDGAAAACSFNGPEGLCCTTTEIFVADTRNHAIRRIDLDSGCLTTLAGNGERGPVLDSHWSNGHGIRLASPWDLELVGARLFFANAGTHQLGELLLEDGALRRAAGSGREGIHDGPDFHAQLAQPSGLAYDSHSHKLYFVDSETSSVRSLDLESHRVETLVGSGLFVYGDSVGSFDDSRLQHPLAIAFCDGRLYVTDTYNNAVKVLDPALRSVESLDSGQYQCLDSLCIPLREPAGVACDDPDRVLVVDTNNHRIVEFNLIARTSMTWSPPPFVDHRLDLP